jgi:hypothetical protein
MPEEDTEHKRNDMNSVSLEYGGNHISNEKTGFDSEDGSDNFLRNVSSYKDYTAQYPRSWYL